MLIFCGKKVGFELLVYLVDRKDAIERVVIANSSDAEIIEFAKKTGLIFEVFDQTTFARIKAEDKKYTWILSLWNSHILPQEILALGKFKLNLHPSLLPYGRGSDSTAWAIRENSNIGVSLIDIVEEVDAGGIYAQCQIDRKYTERGLELHLRLQDEIIRLFKKEWPQISCGGIQPNPQGPGGSFHRRKETNLDRCRDSNHCASLGETIDWILAHDFHPGTTAEMTRHGKRYKLRVSVDPIE